jgi:Tfp pilus assembly PilM family ATPase
VNEFVDALASGISGVIDYSSCRERASRIDRAYISGRIAGMKGVEEYLSEFLDMPVYNLDDIVKTLFKGDAADIEDVAPYIGALGATLREVSK